MAFITFFINKDNVWHHWSWISYFILTVILLFSEYVDYKEKCLSPLNKAKKYLLNHNNWMQANNQRYYSSAPEFTIRTNNEENHLDFSQEWTRGEIGSSYTSQNGAYYSDLYFYETCLKRIRIVIFDGGKKTIAAPDWEPIGNGRIYFYVEDSVEYDYQKYISAIYNIDYSKNIRGRNNGTKFDIPIFKNNEELGKFITFCNIPNSEPESDEDKQNTAFYALLKKYEEFKNTP